MGMATQHIGRLTDGLQYWLQKPPKREMIHEVRVYLKKLRALWLIHPIGNSIAFRYSFPALHKLFKKAGSFRDYQTTLLCLQTLPGWDQENTMADILEKKITAARGKIKQRLHQSSFKHKIANELNQFHVYYGIASRFLLRSTRHHYRTETIRLMVAIDGTTDEQLHDLRKMIKNSLYQCEAFPAKVIKEQPNPSYEALLNLEELLGKWHDWWYTAFYLHHLNKASGEPQLKHLQEQAEKKTALLKREVMRNLRKHAPAMESLGITKMDDKLIIHLPHVNQKTARLQKKSTNS